jgi:hypothetical protein
MWLRVGYRTSLRQVGGQNGPPGTGLAFNPVPVLLDPGTNQILGQPLDAHEAEP